MEDNNNSGNTNTIILVIVLVIIVALGVWWFSTKSTVPAEDGGINVDVTLPTSDESPVSGDTSVPSSENDGGVMVQ